MYITNRPRHGRFVNVGPFSHRPSTFPILPCDENYYFTSSDPFFSGLNLSDQGVPGMPGWTCSARVNRNVFGDRNTFFTITYKSYDNGNITWRISVSPVTAQGLTCENPNSHPESYDSEATAPAGAPSVTFNRVGQGYVVVDFTDGSTTLTTTTTTDAPGGGGSSTSTNAFCAKITSVNDNKIEVDIDDCENALGGFNKTITICHGCNSSKLPSGFSEKTIAICDLQGKSVNYVFLVKNADTKSPKPSISLCECTCSTPKPTTTTTSSPPNCGGIIKLCAENFENYESIEADSLNGEWDLDTSCVSENRPCYKKLTGQGILWMKFQNGRWSISGTTIPLVLYANCPEGTWHAENSSTSLGKTAKGDCPITSGACPDKLCGTGFAATQPAGDGLWTRATNSNMASWGLSVAIHNGRPIYVKTGLYMWYPGESTGQHPGVLYDHWKITNSLPGSWVGDTVKLELRSYPTGTHGDLACPRNTQANQWVYEGATPSGFINTDGSIGGPCAEVATTTTTTTTSPPLTCPEILYACFGNPRSLILTLHKSTIYNGKTSWATTANTHFLFWSINTPGFSSYPFSGIWIISQTLGGQAMQSGITTLIGSPGGICPAAPLAWPNYGYLSASPCDAGQTMTTTTTTTAAPPLGCNQNLNGLGFSPPLTEALGVWTFGGLGMYTWNSLPYWHKGGLRIYGLETMVGRKWVMSQDLGGPPVFDSGNLAMEKYGHECPHGYGWPSGYFT